MIGRYGAPTFQAAQPDFQRVAAEASGVARHRPGRRVVRPKSVAIATGFVADGSLAPVTTTDDGEAAQPFANTYVSPVLKYGALAALASAGYLLYRYTRG